MKDENKDEKKRNGIKEEEKRKENQTLYRVQTAGNLGKLMPLEQQGQPR